MCMGGGQPEHKHKWIEEVLADSTPNISETSHFQILRVLNRQSLRVFASLGAPFHALAGWKLQTPFFT